MKDKQHLIAALAHLLATGKLDARSVLPAIEKLAGDSRKSIPELLEDFEGETDETLIVLSQHLRQNLLKEALRLHSARKQKLPAGNAEIAGSLPLETVEEWTLIPDRMGGVLTAIQMSQDLAFLAANQEKAAVFFSEMQQQSAKSLTAASLVEVVERLPKPLLDRLADAWLDNLPGREKVMIQLYDRRILFRRTWLEQAGKVARGLTSAELDFTPETLADRFALAESRDAAAWVVDLACCWMTPAIVPALEAMSREAWARDRISWNLTLRFGKPENETWEQWRTWLDGQERLWQSEQTAFGLLIDNDAAALLLVLYSCLPEPDPAVLNALVKRVAELGKPVDVSALWPRPKNREF